MPSEPLHAPRRSTASQKQQTMEAKRPCNIGAPAVQYQSQERGNSLSVRSKVVHTSHYDLPLRNYVWYSSFVALLYLLDLGSAYGGKRQYSYLLYYESSYPVNPSTETIEYMWKALDILRYVHSLFSILWDPLWTQASYTALCYSSNKGKGLSPSKEGWWWQFAPYWILTSKNLQEDTVKRQSDAPWG